MFYFQQLLNKGLAGIDQTAIIPTVVGIAYTILLIGFLVGLYQAALRGGDVQALAVTAIKYVVVAIILANWTVVFREVNDSFNEIAQFIDSSSGAGDMFLSWMDQLKQQFSNNGFSAMLPAISGSMAAAITALMLVGAYLIYAIAVVIFAFFYVLYGCVLYVFGPVVLALLPIAGVGQLAKGYATNLMVWNAWGILYATFGSLITAIQFNRIDQVMNQGFLSGFFQGSSDSTVLGLVSIFYAIALVLIPFIAKRVISGDVGSSAYSLVRAGASAGGALVAGITGFAAGAGIAETSPALSAGAGAASSPVTSAMPAMISAAAPPPQPSMAQTIRSGIMSAVSGAAPPASSNGRTDQKAAVVGVSSRPSFGAVSAMRTAIPGGLRPIGVAQTVAFHAGRFAGSVASRGG